MKPWHSLSILALSTSVFVAGCSGSNNDDNTQEDDATLALAFSNLPPLGDDFVYEGWIIVNGAALSTGRFSQTDNVTQTISTDISSATAYILTIEPAVGDDPAPAATHIIAGDIIDNAATLSTSHSSALNTGFSNATGRYVLETPTTAAVEDYTQGVWFVVAGQPGLVLPVLPNGWVYEGWVVGDDGPVTTGRFTDPGAADADGAGPTAGPSAFPPFPGQDFINPPVSLVGQAVVLTVEPDPDNAAGPFPIRPLIDDNVEDLGEPGLAQDMANTGMDGLPSGTLTITIGN